MLGQVCKGPRHGVFEPQDARRKISKNGLTLVHQILPVFILAVGVQGSKCHLVERFAFSKRVIDPTTDPTLYADEVAIGLQGRGQLGSLLRRGHVDDGVKMSRFRRIFICNILRAKSGKFFVVTGVGAGGNIPAARARHLNQIMPNASASARNKEAAARDRRQFVECQLSGQRWAGHRRSGFQIYFWRYPKHGMGGQGG